MSKLKYRPLRLNRAEDINPTNIEKMLTAYDDNFRQLDRRRIAQMSALDTSAELSNVVTKLNDLIAALNASELTED